MRVCGMPVERKSVYSSWISDIEYDSDTQVLTVGYQNGGASSHKVPPEIAEMIWRAPSIGEALHANVPGFTKRGPRGSAR